MKPAWPLRRHGAAVALLYLLAYGIAIAPGYLVSRIFAGIENASPSLALVGALIAVLVVQLIIGALDNFSTLWLAERHFGVFLLDFVNNFDTQLKAPDLASLFSVDLSQVSRDFALRAALVGQIACVACCCAVVFAVNPMVLPYALVPVALGATLMLFRRRGAAAAGEAQRSAQGKLRAIEQLSLNGIDFMRSPTVSSLVLDRLNCAFLQTDSSARLQALNARIDCQSFQNMGSALSLGIAVVVMWLAGASMAASQLVLVVSYMGTMSLLTAATVDSLASLRISRDCLQRWNVARLAQQPAGPAHFDLSEADRFCFCGTGEFVRLTGISAVAFEAAATEFGLDPEQLKQLSIDGEGLSRGQSLLAYLAAVKALMGSRDWTVSDRFGGLDTLTALRVREALGDRVRSGVAG